MSDLETTIEKQVKMLLYRWTKDVEYGAARKEGKEKNNRDN